MTIRINIIEFMSTFAADATYHTHLEGQEVYLCRKYGDLLVTISNPERVAYEMGKDAVEAFLEDTKQVQEDPGGYLEIRSMSHGEHHQVMQKFLNSDWSADKNKCGYALNVYFPRKSIGYWLKEVGDQNTIDAYFSFKEAEHILLAEQYLRENGVSDFTWK